MIPAFLAVFLLMAGVEEPNVKTATEKWRPQWRDIKRFSFSFWEVVAIAGVFTLARFSEAFLVLKAQATGLPIALVPIVMVVMNIAYAASAYPAGVFSDRVGRRSILLFGLGTLIIADLILAIGMSVFSVLAGVLIWGVHMGMTQGLFATLIADTAPVELRGTAFGIYNLVAGGAMLVASIVAGGLWDWYGPAATFLAGAIFASIALSGILLVQRHELHQTR